VIRLLFSPKDAHARDHARLTGKIKRIAGAEAKKKRRALVGPAASVVASVELRSRR
jgi:hypothetical protein